jgi:hypothetical protein
MGVTPNEGTLGLPDLGDPRQKACDCLQKYPLAALDAHFHFEPGNQTFDISPSCMISVF